MNSCPLKALSEPVLFDMHKLAFISKLAVAELSEMVALLLLAPVMVVDAGISESADSICESVAWTVLHLKGEEVLAIVRELAGETVFA